jgi:hypothetical protein
MLTKKQQENLLAIEDILSRASGQPTVKRLFESFQDNTPAPKVTEDVVKLCLIDKKTGRYVSVSWMTEPAIGKSVACQQNKRQSLMSIESICYRPYRLGTLWQYSFCRSGLEF